MVSAYNDTTVFSQSVSKGDSLDGLPAFDPIEESGAVYVEAIEVSIDPNIELKEATDSSDRDLTTTLKIQTKNGFELSSYSKTVTINRDSVAPFPEQLFTGTDFYLQEGKQILLEFNGDTFAFEFNESGDFNIEITPIGRRAV